MAVSGDGFMGLLGLLRLRISVGVGRFLFGYF
jgi:hypothetical protein